MLHIHSDIIDKIILNKLFEKLWISTIRIKFYEKPKWFYFFYKWDESRLKGWLSSTNRHCVKQSPSVLDERKEYFFPKKCILNLLNPLWKDKIRIMTKTTPEITSRSKNHTRDFPRIIYKRKFLESRNIHTYWAIKHLRV
jgi:hypothetical protein